MAEVYRNPKTGEIHSSLVWICPVDKPNCDECPISFRHNGIRVSCKMFIKQYPYESAQLMGYEVIDEDMLDAIPESLPDITTFFKEAIMEENQKPLSEWTLEEVKKECSHKNRCIDCHFYKEGSSSCLLSQKSPRYWEVEDKTNWVEDEINAAKMLLRLTDVKWIARDRSGCLTAFPDEPFIFNGEFTSEWECDSIPLNAVEFASLEPEQKARLEYMANCDTHS